MGATWAGTEVAERSAGAPGGPGVKMTATPTPIRVITKADAGNR